MPHMHATTDEHMYCTFLSLSPGDFPITHNLPYAPLNKSL